MLVSILAVGIMGCGDSKEAPPVIESSRRAPIVPSELHLAPPPQPVENVIKTLPPPPAIVAGPNEVVFVGEKRFSVDDRCLSYSRSRESDSIEDGRHVIRGTAEDFVGEVLTFKNERNNQFLIKSNIPATGVFEIMKDGKIEPFDFLEPGKEDGWEVRPGISGNSSVFPSEVTDGMPVTFNFYAFLDVRISTPLEKFPSLPGMEAELRSDCRAERAYYIDLKHTTDVAAEDEQGFKELVDLANLAVPLIATAGRVVDRNRFFEQAKVFANTYHTIGVWFDDLPEGEKLALMDTYGPTALNLLLMLVDKPILDSLVDGSWEEIRTINPNWYVEWPHHDESKIVAYYGMSRLELGFKLFLARRGEAVYKKAQAIIKGGKK